MNARPESAGAARLDVASIARRAVVGIAAAAGLFGILAGRPVLPVVLRAGIVALGGLVAIAIAERCASRARASHGSRGGAR